MATRVSWRPSSKSRTEEKERSMPNMTTMERIKACCTAKDRRRKQQQGEFVKVAA